MLKRLSRVEYQNTVNDVFGIDFSMLDRLPLDNIEAGFNNNADNLHMSVFDMESYFNVANLIAESVVSDKPAPRVVVYSTKNTDIDTLYLPNKEFHLLLDLSKTAELAYRAPLANSGLWTH